ncbi:MAG: bifunctional alpha/beta hydrolase/OsmC family protein [Rhodobacteraceae bacterium]|nr:bifunctional alpha/beta hydrolase/OsmC family protein [Paracoccaceae bacterium]
MTTERFVFDGHAGHKLSARLDRPDYPPRTTALFAHCFTCSKDIPAARRIAEKLSSLGIAVLRFDFSGLGHSEGEFENTNFTSNVADLEYAARHLESVGLAPSIIIGHSLGGAAVLKAAGNIGSIKAVVTIGAPADPGHVAHHFGRNLDKIRSEGEAEVNLGGRYFTIKKQFVEDIDSASLKPAIANLRRALLILHAPLDKTVGIENAAEIFAAARHPKSFVTLDKADHLITRHEDAEYAAEVIAAWVSRYLPDEAERDIGRVPDGTVRVSEDDADGFRQMISVGGKFQMFADESKQHKGTGTGPNPYQFLSAGLGACTAMTIRMYARHKNWPLDHVEVDVSFDRIYADDCTACDKAQTRVDTFTRLIRLRGTLTDGQRERMLAIADKCPVHKTLSGNARVATSLVDE